MTRLILTLVLSFGINFLAVEQIRAKPFGYWPYPGFQAAAMAPFPQGSGSALEIVTLPASTEQLTTPAADSNRSRSVTLSFILAMLPIALAQSVFPSMSSLFQFMAQSFR
jgi:hypothetical protein